MSLLDAPLPEGVKYGGKEYALHTDFRRWIDFFRCAARGDALGMLKVYRALPPDFGAALTLALEFANGAALPYGGAGKRAVLDFDFDAALIYAAFMGQYGIDLCSAQLHWYKFCALLAGLSEECRLRCIMAVRSADAGKIADKARRASLRRLQRHYSLPDRRSAAVRDAALIGCLAEFY